MAGLVGPGPRGLPGGARSVSRLGPLDDRFAGASLAARWHLNGIPTVSVAGGVLTLTANARGDGIYQRPARMPAGARGVHYIAHFTDNEMPAAMVGLVILDAEGNGAGYSPYGDGNTYLWHVAHWGYASTGPHNSGQPSLRDYWLDLHATGAGGYAGRWGTGTWPNIRWEPHARWDVPAVQGPVLFGIAAIYGGAPFPGTCRVAEFRVVPG